MSIELSNVDFSFSMKVLNVQLNIVLPQIMNKTTEEENRLQHEDAQHESIEYQLYACSLLSTQLSHHINLCTEVKKWSRTSESPACSLDSPEYHTAASILNLAGCCYSAPALSDGWGWTSELRPEKNS